MVTAAMARTGTIPQTPASAGSCKKKCPGGYQCNCDSNIDHALHICKNPDCWCHSLDRYEGRSFHAQE